MALRSRIDSERIPRHGRQRLSSMAVAGTLAVAVLAHAFHVTRGFDRLTFEALRESRVATGDLGAPPTDIELADGHRQSLWKRSEGRGVRAGARAYLVDFIYARCPGVCRALGGEFRTMSDALGHDGAGAGVQLVSISIETSGASPSDLRAYSRAHGADQQTWWVGQAAPDQTRRLLRALDVVAIPDGFGGFVHNGDIHLIDGTGRVRGIFSYDEGMKALEAARRLARSAP
jgi:protein SCO1/2